MNERLCQKRYCCRNRKIMCAFCRKQNKFHLKLEYQRLYQQLAEDAKTSDKKEARLK